jgi:hypothetical protein
VLALESFNETLNTQPLYIPTSNHLSKRDTYSDAIDKGLNYLCFLEFPFRTRQSIYTTGAYLESSGWTRYPDAGGLRKLDFLEPAFNRLGLTYDPADVEQIMWQHDLWSVNSKGQEAPVRFYRLY